MLRKRISAFLLAGTLAGYITAKEEATKKMGKIRIA